MGVERPRTLPVLTDEAEEGGSPHLHTRDEQDILAVLRRKPVAARLPQMCSEFVTPSVQDD